MSTASFPIKFTLKLRTAIAGWLTIVCVMILLMVAIGGVTRLTGSGLSIVNWEPVSGVLPPLSDAAWDAEFQSYQKSPQYELVNAGMTLEQFQEIYFWEYVHRLFARLVGLVYVVPFAMLLFQKMIDKPLAIKLWIGLGLGGLQGVMGWCMVQSGLVDQPQVSHYRLAAHLLLALGTAGYLFWTALSLYRDRAEVPSADPRSTAAFRRFGYLILALVVVQITYGAFTAGLKAGFTYNSFPLMYGKVIAPESFAFSPFAKNLFENPIMIQFVHRTLGLVFAAVVLGAWIYSRGSGLAPRQRRSISILATWTVFQLSSGILTLLLRVPIPLAVLHQVGAVVVFLVIVYGLHVSRLPAAARQCRSTNSGKAASARGTGASPVNDDSVAPSAPPFRALT